MRTCIVMLMILGMAGTAIAQELGNSRELPVKNTPVVTYEPPAVPKQGGDTVFDAYPIADLPFTDTGTTAGYNNDYDESCPYSASISPDVVYSYTPSKTISISVDLCGSGYDTKTYIYDSNLNHIICNDDFYNDDICGVYVSKIEYAELMGGETYYIFVDGYGGDSGDYILNITENLPCPPLTCPADAVDEGEPPLHDGYEDAYNGGCNSPDLGAPFQNIDWINVEPGNPNDGSAWLCGSSGWYITGMGEENRDTDWYRVFAIETGVMGMAVFSEFPVYIFKLFPLDCATTEVDLQAIADCDAPGTLIFPVTAGEEIWLWVGPTIFNGPVTEFTYFMTVSNNTFDVVPNEDMSWGGVKSLYR